MNSLALFLIGFVAGTVLVAAVFLSVMRTRMVVAHRSRRTFAETCAAIEKIVPTEKGWGFPIDTWNFYETFAQKNLVPEGFVNLKVYFVCNAGHASKMLTHTPSFVGMMPCSWAVYEMADGSVWLAKMNVGLMSKMFSGVPGRMMRIVGQADDKFLGEVLG
ncbi:MAG: DUF302 domain-containing protein [Candidatus Krumholzibacteriota bacterium]